MKKPPLKRMSGLTVADLVESFQDALRKRGVAGYVVAVRTLYGGTVTVCEGETRGLPACVREITAKPKGTK